MQIGKIKKLCLAAGFAAIYVLLDYIFEQFSFGLFSGNVKITLSGLPIILGAMLLGPVWGAMIAGVGDFLSQIISYGLSAQTFLYVAPQVLCGLAVGFIFIAFKSSNKLLPVFFNITVTRIILTALNTAAQYIDDVFITKAGSLVFLTKVPIRIASAVVTSIVLTIIIPPVLKALQKVVKRG